MHSTNYLNTFIAIAEDSPTATAKVPILRDPPSVAQLEFELLDSNPYSFTSDDLLFRVHCLRRGIDETPDSRDEFFSKGQACLRASPLAKSHGWGFHLDENGKVALVPSGSEEYKRLSCSSNLQQVRAMRNKRT
ncbi:MAG: hypothetical protein JST40_11215 [Armatimonadetes bacterium]|nr:hypothetical protein [Armatimonadota bacterium]